MVDRSSRDRFAELLRHFVAGNLTNDEYEDAAISILKSADRKDRLLGALYSRVWFFYDDTRVHRLRDDRAMNKEGRRIVARWILFLHSDLEYEWPIRSFISLPGCLLRVCTLGIAGLILNPINERRFKRLGSWELWPFFREVDFQASKARPWLLGGAH